MLYATHATRYIIKTMVQDCWLKVCLWRSAHPSVVLFWSIPLNIFGVMKSVCKAGFIVGPYEVVLVTAKKHYYFDSRG